SLSRCFILWSVSAKRGRVSSAASSMGVWEVPAANTIIAMISLLSSSPCRQRRYGVWNRSVHMHVGALGNSGPFALFRSDEGAELRRRPWLRDGAEIADVGLHLGRAQALVDRRVKQGDDRLRGAGGSDDAVEGGDLVVGNAGFDHGRQVA